MPDDGRMTAERQKEIETELTFTQQGDQKFWKLLQMLGETVFELRCLQEDRKKDQKKNMELLDQINAIVTEGLPLLPKIMLRTDFVRECVRMQREIGAGTLTEYKGPLRA